MFEVSSTIFHNMLSSEYSWNATKKIKDRIKIFGEDDFKFFIFISIFIFCLAGVVLITTGIFIKNEVEEIYLFIGLNHRAISISLVVIGSFILVVSSIGIYGVFKDINAIIYMYTFFLFLMITAQLAISVGPLIGWRNVSSKVEKNMQRGLQLYGTKGHEEVTALWDKVQIEMSCCGVHSLTDWIKQQDAIPDSCNTQVNFDIV